MSDMHDNWNAFMGTGMGLGMWIFWIVVLVVVVLVIKLIINNTSSQSDAPAESALETLRKRYARGEIDRQEYEQIKNDLEK